MRPDLKHIAQVVGHVGADQQRIHPSARSAKGVGGDHACFADAALSRKNNDSAHLTLHVCDAHFPVGMIPALHYFAARYDAAGAALQAALVGETNLAVLIFVESGRAGEDDLADLFLILVVFVDLYVGISLIGVENIIAQFIIYRYFFCHF
jgi:hypothetical protein